MKKQAAKDQDKFVVRLPDGMRERIKAGADREGMSMNEAVVWCLDRFFPAPRTFETRVGELAEMVAMLKEDGRENEALDHLINDIHVTIREISEGKLKVPPDFKGKIHDRLEQWDQERADSWSDLHDNPFEDPVGDLDEP